MDSRVKARLQKGAPFVNARLQRDNPLDLDLSGLSVDPTLAMQEPEMPAPQAPDPLGERVRAYLTERMNAAPEAAPDYSRERQLDVIGNAGTNISNIFLNRAGLGQMKAGEGFEAAARRDAVRPKETRDELASVLYESNQRAKLMAEREAGLGARTAVEDERLRAKATEDARLKEARLAQDAEALKARADTRGRAHIEAATARLTVTMGALFKALALTGRDWPTPAGFGREAP